MDGELWRWMSSLVLAGDLARSGSGRDARKSHHDVMSENDKFEEDLLRRVEYGGFSSNWSIQKVSRRSKVFSRAVVQRRLWAGRYFR